MVEAQISPEVARARVIAAVSNNLNEDNEGADFERRMKMAEMMLKDKDLNIKAADIQSNEKIAKMQTMANLYTSQKKAAAG